MYSIQFTVQMCMLQARGLSLGNREMCGFVSLLSGNVFQLEDDNGVYMSTNRHVE